MRVRKYSTYAMMVGWMVLAGCQSSSYPSGWHPRHESARRTWDIYWKREMHRPSDMAKASRTLADQLAGDLDRMNEMVRVLLELDHPRWSGQGPAGPGKD